MEVKYKAPSIVEQTTTLSNDQLDQLKEIALACLVDRTYVLGLGSAHMGYELKLKAICESLGVDITSKTALRNFLQSALSVAPEMFQNPALM